MPELDQLELKAEIGRIAGRPSAWLRELFVMGASSSSTGMGSPTSPRTPPSPDVNGQPFDRYLHKQVFEPLGMSDTDLLRSEAVKTRFGDRIPARVRRRQARG